MREHAESDDDAHGGCDRSRGDQSHESAGGRAYRFTSSTNASQASGLGFAATTVTAYDVSGYLTRLGVVRPGGKCLTGGSFEVRCTAFTNGAYSADFQSSLSYKTANVNRGILTMAQSTVFATPATYERFYIKGTKSSLYLGKSCMHCGLRRPC
jgi:hypothetical protein